jgi:glycine/serine hydroxymethyltransferase
MSEETKKQEYDHMNIMISQYGDGEYSWSVSVRGTVGVHDSREAMKVVSKKLWEAILAATIDKPEYSEDVDSQNKADIGVSIGISNNEEFKDWSQQVVAKAKELNDLLSKKPILQVNAATDEETI